MNIKKEQELLNIVENAISVGKETEQFDFKQEWHSEMKDLIKDIICFANTVHNRDCYILFWDFRQFRNNRIERKTYQSE